MLNRRSFVRLAARYGSGVLVAPWVEGLLACRDAPGPGAVPEVAGGYGPLFPSGDVEQLALPPEFRCALISQSGQPMTNGQPTPAAFDGMATFPLPNGNIRLIRNHELRDSAQATRVIGDPARSYDLRGPGGTTSLELRVAADGKPTIVRDFVSLSGTMVNCAGGPTPWGTWLSCEETTQGLGPGHDRLRPHGYVFEVSGSAESEVDPIPLTMMGRFVHEAVAVDPQTGVVYLTEDSSFDQAGQLPGAGFYRFSPAQYGRLAAGGRLQALAIRGRPRYHSMTGQPSGIELPVAWVDLPEPDPAGVDGDASAVFRQALANGAAVFQRLEGCWYADGSVFFHSTSGGDAGLGQVWQYRIRGGSEALLLLFESRFDTELDGPDNLTVSPRGGLLICEDGAGEQYLRGLTRAGTIFPFALNRISGAEFCGACFSPDGRTLFVNLQGSTVSTGGTPSFTFAIWGPWERGAL